MRRRTQYCSYLRLRKFFRLRLLSLDNEEIANYLSKLDKEAKALKTEALKFSWHMRGGLTYDQALMLSEVERNIISKIVEENAEITKKTGLSYF